MSSRSVENITILNTAIPPSQQLPIVTPGYHGSSRSLNLISYKAVQQYPIPTIESLSQRDVYNLNAYTAELNYSVTPRSSNRDLHNTAHLGNVDRPLPSRQNSIVIAQNPRFSAYGYPHTVQLLNSTPPEHEIEESKTVVLYCKLAWLSCLFFLPLGIFAVKKFYESKKYRYKNPNRAEAASDVSRFVSTFAILLGVVIYMLIVVIRLRITYESGNNFF